MKSIDKLSPEKLRKLYWQEKMSSPGIAKLYHCDPKYIRTSLKKYGIQIRAVSEAKRGHFKVKIPKKELKRLYLKKKLSSLKIAKIYQCGQATVRYRLRRYGIKTRTLSEASKARFNINIPKKELKKLYIEREISSPEIAKIYRCSPNTVRDLLREYGIRIRTKSEAARFLYGINISKKELKKLYLEKKMSSVEIAKKFNCSPVSIRERLREYRIPIRSHYEAHLLCNKPRYPRYNFKGNLEEKAYLIGFCYGDLHAELTSLRSISVSMHSSKIKQIKLFAQLFSKYGHVCRGKPDNLNAISIRCYLNRTFDFLLNKKDLIEPWVLKSRKYFAAFLAGYTDAEGSFCICGGKGVVYVGSQDKTIIHQIRKKLIELGILCRPPQIKRKKGTRDIKGTISNEDIWGLWIHRKDAILKLIDLINPYLKHAEKRKNMEMVKDNIFWRNKKYNNQRDRRFYKLYLKEGIKI